MNELNSFALRLRSELLDRAAMSSSDDVSGRKENLFTLLMIESLTEGGYIEDGEVVYFSKQTTKGSVKTNGYYYDDDEGLLNIYVTLYSDFELPEKNYKADIQKQIESAARFFDYAIQENRPVMEPSSDQYGMLETIYDNRNNIYQVKIFIFTDGISPEKIPDSVTKKERTFQVQVWDIQRLFRSEAYGSFYEAIQIDLKEDFPYEVMCVPMSRQSDEYDAYLAILPGKFLCDIYDHYGSRLMELNVRSFLQAKGKVNKGIKDTIREQPGRFFAYNNGISATAEFFETYTHEDGRILISRIKNLQIVNGGQTTASIHRAGTVDKYDLSEVFVQAKITVAGQEKMEELVPKIARYANSQNAISEADFASNDSFHIELERLSKQIWAPGEQRRWFYERARGQYQVEKNKHKDFDKTMPASHKFTKTDMAKYLNSWNRKPYIVSRGAQANFTSFMSDLNKDVAVDEMFFKELVSKGILFKAIYDIVKLHKFPGYNANIVTYTMSYLSYRIGARLNLEQIWTRQSVSEALYKTVDVWCNDVYNRIIRSASGRNVTQWCKKEECWNAVKQLDLTVPLDLQNELLTEQFQGTSRFANSRTSKDLDSVAKLREVSADLWFAISKSDNIEGMNASLSALAHKISGIAAGGWKKPLSSKLTFQGMQILKLASNEFPEIKEIL